MNFSLAHTYFKERLKLYYFAGIRFYILNGLGRKGHSYTYQSNRFFMFENHMVLWLRRCIL